MAQGVGDAQAREAARKRLLDDQTTAKQSNVPDIPQTDSLRSEERKGGSQQQGKPGSGSGGAETDSGQASVAEPHLDFLA
jgi:hypothetical protein